MAPTVTRGLAFILILITISAPDAYGNVQCYECDNVHDSNGCNQVTTCPSDQMCGVKTLISDEHTHSYTFGCFDARICVALTSRLILLQDLAVGRRSLVACNICCGNSLCNVGDCRQLEQKLYTLYKQGRLNMTTLEYH